MSTLSEFLEQWLFWLLFGIGVALLALPLIAALFEVVPA